MKVSDILRVKGNTLYTANPDEPLGSALNLMAEKDIGSLVVMDHGDLVGMLTFREVIQLIVKNGGGVNHVPHTRVNLLVPASAAENTVVAHPGLDVVAAQVRPHSGTQIVSCHRLAHRTNVVAFTFHGHQRGVTYGAAVHPAAVDHQFAARQIVGLKHFFHGL